MTDQAAGAAAGDITPAQAQAQLSALTSNAEWAGKLMSADPGARSDFDRLTKVVAGVSNLDIAKTTSADADQPFTTTSGNELSPAKVRTAIGDLAEIGLDHVSIEQILTDHRLPPEKYEQARQEYQARVTNKEFIERYLAGDARAKREMTYLAATMIAAERR